MWGPWVDGLTSAITLTGLRKRVIPQCTGISRDKSLAYLYLYIIPGENPHRLTKLVHISASSQRAHSALVTLPTVQVHTLLINYFSPSAPPTPRRKRDPVENGRTNRQHCWWRCLTKSRRRIFFHPILRQSAWPDAAKTELAAACQRSPPHHDGGGPTSNRKDIAIRVARSSPESIQLANTSSLVNVGSVSRASKHDSLASTRPLHPSSVGPSTLDGT